MFGGTPLARADLVPVKLPASRVAAKFITTWDPNSRSSAPLAREHDEPLGKWQGICRARMTNIFLQDQQGRRPVFGNREKFQTDRTGATLSSSRDTSTVTRAAGVGASHQTGWTGVVTKLMQQSGESRERKKTNRWLPR